MSSKNASRKPILQRVYDHAESEPTDLRKKLSRVADDFDSIHKELFPSGRAKETLREPQLFPGTEESDRHLRRVRTVKPVLKRIMDPIELSSEEEIVIMKSRKASKSRKKSFERKHRNRSRSSSRNRRRSRSRSPIRPRRSRSSSRDRRHKKHRSKKSRSQKLEKRISRRKSSSQRSSRKISSDLSSTEKITGDSSTTSYLTNGERSRTESSDVPFQNFNFSKTIENPQKNNQKSDVWSEASIRNARLKMMILQPEINSKQGENRQKSPRVIRVGRKDQSRANGKSVNSATSSSEPITGSSTESDADRDNPKFINSCDIDYRKIIPAQSVSVRRLKIRGTQRKKLEKLNEKKNQPPARSHVIVLSSAEEDQLHQKSASEEGEILSDADRRKISVDSERRDNVKRSENASHLSKSKRKLNESSNEPTQEVKWNDDDSLDALEENLIDPLAEMDSMINHVIPGTPSEEDIVIQQDSFDQRRDSDFGRRGSSTAGDIVQPEVYFDIFLDQLILDLAQDVFKTAIERECLLMEMTDNIFDKLIGDSTQEIAVRSAENEIISRAAVAKTYFGFVDELFADLLQEQSQEVKAEKKNEEILFLLDNLEDHDDCCLEGRPGSDCSRFSEALDAMDERLSNTWVKQLEEFDDITVKGKAQICLNELFSCDDFADLDHQGMIEIEFEQEDYEVVYKWPNLARKQRFLKRKSDQNTKSPIKKKLDELIAKSKSKQVSSMKIQSTEAETCKKSSKIAHRSPKSTVQQRLGSVDQNLPVYDQETEDCFAATKTKVEVINLLSSDESEKLCATPTKMISDEVLENLYESIISSITSNLAKKIGEEKKKEDDLIKQVTEKSVLRIFDELYGKEQSCMKQARESIESSIRALTQNLIQREINLMSVEDAAFTKLVDSLLSQTCKKILEKEKVKKLVAVDFFTRLITDEVKTLISAQMKKQETKSDPVMKSWVCSQHDFSSLTSEGFNELKQHKLLSKSDFKNSPKLLIQSLNLSGEDSVLIERWWHEAQPKKFSISTLLGKSPSSSQAAAPKVQPGMTGAMIAQEQADVFDPLSALGLEYNTKRRQSIMEELKGLKYAVCDSKSPKVTTPGKDKLGANSKGTPKDYRSNFQKGTRLKTTIKTRASSKDKRPRKVKDRSGACSSNSNSPKSVSHDTSNTSSASVTAKSTPSSSKTVSKSRSRKLQRPTENVFDGIRRTLGDRRSSLKAVPSLCGPRKDLTSEEPLDCVDNFRLDAIIGEGTFGQVFRGECKITKSLVALKKVRMDREKEGFPITAIREVKLLSKLSHRNVVDLRTVVQAKDLSSFFLVFEFVDNDLTGIIENAPLKSDQIKKLFYQILLGLEYCHKNDVFHRDLKCSNILIAKDGSVKLGDFGLARICLPTDPRPFTNKVITLWYRPPELLVGDDRYTAKIDMWSAGCILGEMFQRKPVFQASTDVAQLEVISKLCGIPDPAAWPEIIHYKHFKTLVTPLITRFHPKPRRKIAEQFCALPPDALDVLDGLLRLNPKTRLSATEALQKPWFRFLSETAKADLGSPENLHEMSARRKRKAKRQAKRADSFSDKMAKIKRLTSSFPQLTLIILAEKAGIELTHEVRENLGSQRLSRIFGSTLPQQTIEPIADIVIQLASKNILIRKTARL